MQLPPGGSSVYACLHCMCLEVRLVGILGNLDDRTCKFQEKLNPAITYRIKIFADCLLRNLCLHLKCGKESVLFLFMSLAYLTSMNTWRKFEKKESERKKLIVVVGFVFCFCLYSLLMPEKAIYASNGDHLWLLTTMFPLDWWW